MASKINEVRARIADLTTGIENRTKAWDEQLPDQAEVETQEADKKELEKAKRIVAAYESNIVNQVKGNVDRSSPARSFVQTSPAFKNIGQYVLTARAAKVDRDQSAIEKIHNTLTTYGSEGTAADGGVMVPGEFPQTLDKLIYPQDSLAGMVTRIPITQQEITFPVDNRLPWAPFSGTSKAAIISEANAYGQVKPLLTTLKISTEKVGFVMPLTDELIQDTSGQALSAFIAATSNETFVDVMNDAILYGAGATKGIMSSSALLTVSASTTATANLAAQDVEEMYCRMPPNRRTTAVWLVSPGTTERSLSNLGFPSSGTATWPLYTPPGGLSVAPYATLLGRPIYVIPQKREAFGTVGDIAFVDLSNYWMVTKGGINQATSIHLWFDQGTTAMRWDIRCGGNTRPPSTLTLTNGTIQGYFVVLETRGA